MNVPEGLVLLKDPIGALILLKQAKTTEMTAWFRIHDLDGNDMVEKKELVKHVASIFKMFGDNQVNKKLPLPWYNWMFLLIFWVVYLGRVKILLDRLSFVCRTTSFAQGGATEEGGPEERASAIFEVNSKMQE